MKDPIKEQYSSILEEAEKIVTGRGEDYGGFAVDDYMPLGHESYYQMCYLKVQRAMSEARNNRSPDDSLLDLINYAAFWLGFCRTPVLADPRTKPTLPPCQHCGITLNSSSHFVRRGVKLQIWLCKSCDDKLAPTYNHPSCEE